MAGNYWTATDDYLRGHGGRGPTCTACGAEMFAADDHGRFACFCGGRGKKPSIPQVPTEGMSNAEKAAVPPINHLHSAPTTAEKKVLDMMARGIDGPEYQKACDELDAERTRAKR